MATAGDKGVFTDGDAILTITPITKVYDGTKWNIVNKGMPQEITLTDLVAYITTNSTVLTDAPSDASAYGRKAGAWVKVTEAA